MSTRLFSTLLLRGGAGFFLFAAAFTGCSDIYVKQADSFTSLSCLKAVPSNARTQLNIPAEDSCIYSLKIESDKESTACLNNPNAKVHGKGHFFRLSLYERQREVYRAQINFTSDSDSALRELLDRFKDDISLSPKK